MTNKIIRHGNIQKVLYEGKNLKFLSAEGIISAVNFGKSEPMISSITTSPQIRAIETGYWIDHGYAMKNQHIERTADKRLDIAKFQPGYTPDAVGAQESYRHMIEATPKEMFATGQKIANFMTEKLSLEGNLAVTHEVPIALFLYLLKINDESSQTPANLQGFSYGIDRTIDPVHPIITADGLEEKRFLIDRQYLDALVNSTANCRYEAKRV